MPGTTIDQGLATAVAKIEDIKSAVEDGAENVMREAKQSLRRARNTAEEAGVELAHQMKRHPAESAGIVFGVGLLAGLALGATLFGRRKRANGDAAAT